MFSDLEPFVVSVLHPGRTLLEKLVLIHLAAQGLVSEPPQASGRRIGRHFYDVFQLLGDRHVLELLADRDQVNLVINSIGHVGRTDFGADETTELRPDEGFATSPAFDPSREVSQRMRANYERTMPELHFGTSALPSWGAICGRVADLRELL